MISLIGEGLILGSLLFSVLGAVLGFVSAKRASAIGAHQTRWMAYIFGGLMVASMVLMEYALLTNDFSVSYVAEVGSLETPRLISFVSLWSSLDGSILFWGAVLGCYTLVFARKSRNMPQDQSTWALAVLMAVGVFFAFLIERRQPLRGDRRRALGLLQRPLGVAHSGDARRGDGDLW